jgi:glycosyltransferase involved in cell wall biosynthesis
LRTNAKQHNISLYFFWGTGLAHALIFLNKIDFKCIAVRFHGIDIYEERHAASYIPFRKQQLQNIHLAAPVSIAGKNYLLSRYSDLDFQCDVFRLGCVSAGRAVESSDGILRIASCSSIIPLKRLDLLVKALAMVSFPFHWLHIGDGPARPEIEALIKNLPANARVTLAGKVDPDQLLQYYAGKPVDIFVNVSETEGVPVSIMEAFSAGIPVLATNVGGTSEIVTDEVGKLLPADLTPEQLASELTAFNNMDKDAKAKLRDRCYQQYMLTCNAQVWAERIVEKIVSK